MNQIHMINQGKGGVGKTVCAVFLAQYKLSRGTPTTCLDLDPVNASFSQFLALKAQHFPLMDEQRIDPRKFDEFMETVLSSDDDFIVDSGASTFLPLNSYLVENNALDLLAESNRKVVFHVVITGGQSLSDTVTGFDSVASSLPPTAELVVWLNEHFGPIEMNGKQFEELGIYKDYADRVKGIVRLHKKRADTFEADVRHMFEAKLTIEEILRETKNHVEFGVMPRQRLLIIQREVFAQLDGIFP
ncbi:MAG: conjugal transfer protein TraL [Proteobacteria bacterium]|nr:MAG: conjugal transfer protein TraL [Pseudomonadota bacterium]